MSGKQWMAVAAFGGWLGVGTFFGQDTATPPPPTAKPDATQAAPAAGKVLFSRSLDDKKDAVLTQKQANSDALEAVKVASEERDSLTFLAYEFDVRLVPKQESLAVKARMTVRNDGEKPLKRIALQLSSQLKWEQIKAAGATLDFQQHAVDTDADHTGAVNEALVTLPRELAPKEELKLEVIYSGRISLSGARLERIGAPAPAAEKSDWDRISPEFTGVRGFGNVVWYPVSAPPALLGDAAKLLAEVGQQKLRQQQARVSMSVTSEYSADTLAPNLAVLDGHTVPVVQTAAPENSYPGVVTAVLPETTLGFSAPSLFLLSRQKVDGTGVQVFTTTDDLPSAQGFVTAVNIVTPLVQQWLGTKPKVPLAVVSLADPGDAPSEEGDAFFTGFRASPDPNELEDAMIHSLAHTYFHSPRQWLNEGVPQFLGSLWIEQVQGRQVALQSLGAARGALALAEPGTPGETGGESLMRTSSTVYYRVKATYVLWMLRDVAGDAALAAALKAYVAESDTTPEYFQRLLEKASGKDLQWFFDSWVYHDRGLPDLSITGVFPSKSTAAGQWLVAIDVANDGYAEADVPLTLRSKDSKVTETVRVPARGKVSRRLLIEGLPTEIQVNDGTVPEVQESLHLRKLTADAP